MSKLGDNDRKHISGNVVDISKRFREISSFDAFIDYNIPVDANYKMPSRLKMNNKTLTLAARSDANEARERAIFELGYFTSQPENFLAFAAALDGQSHTTRSKLSHSKIKAVVDLLANHSKLGEINWNIQEIKFPQFNVGSNVFPHEVENSIHDTVLPTPVSMAYVLGTHSDDHVILSGGLGFRDMHVQARNAVLMITVNHARNQGVKIAPGPVILRLSKTLDGMDFNEQLNVKMDQAFGRKPITVRLNHVVISVPSGHYTVDTDLSNL